LGQTLSIVGATVNPVAIAYDTTNAATVGTYSAQNVQTVTDKNGNMQIQFAERPVFDGVTLGDATKNLVTINEGGINITGGGKTVVIEGDKVDFGGNTLTNVAPGAITSTSKDAVNGSQLYNVQAIASKGWNIQTNGDVATQVQPGDTVDIGTAAGENNIKVTRNGNTIDFELNKNLDLGNTGSVKMGDLTINNAWFDHQKWP
jgi:autotransporter adhesin